MKRYAMLILIWPVVLLLWSSLSFAEEGGGVKPNKRGQVRKAETGNNGAAAPPSAESKPAGDANGPSQNEASVPSDENRGGTNGNKKDGDGNGGNIANASNVVKEEAGQVKAEIDRVIAKFMEDSPSLKRGEVITEADKAADKAVKEAAKASAAADKISNNMELKAAARALKNSAAVAVAAAKAVRKAGNRENAEFDLSETERFFKKALKDAEYAKNDVAKDVAEAVSAAVSSADSARKVAKEVVDGDKGAKTEAEEQARKDAEAFLKANFGMSASLSIFGSGRVKDASIDSNKIVRVDRSDNVIPRFMLEAHYFFPMDRFSFGRGKTYYCSGAWQKSSVGVSDTPQYPDCGFGPFVGVIPGSDHVFDSFAVGWMIGMRSPSRSSSFNFGVGAVVDPYAKQLGSGINANQPLPSGETGIRYREADKWGGIVVFSFTY